MCVCIDRSFVAVVVMPYGFVLLLTSVYMLTLVTARFDIMALLITFDFTK